MLKINFGFATFVSDNDYFLPFTMFVFLGIENEEANKAEQPNIVCYQKLLIKSNWFYGCLNA